MTTPRLSPASEVGIEGDKIAKSESLSALFSYFTEWSKQDSSLKFKDESVLKTNEEAAA